MRPLRCAGDRTRTRNTVELWEPVEMDMFHPGSNNPLLMARRSEPSRTCPLHMRISKVHCTKHVMCWVPGRQHGSFECSVLFCPCYATPSATATQWLSVWRRPFASFSFNTNTNATVKKNGPLYLLRVRLFLFHFVDVHFSLSRGLLTLYDGTGTQGQTDSISWLYSLLQATKQRQWPFRSLGEQPEVRVLHGRRDLDPGGIEERHIHLVPRHQQVAAAGAEPLEPAQLQELYTPLQVTHPVLLQRSDHVRYVAEDLAGRGWQIHRIFEMLWARCVVAQLPWKWGCWDESSWTFPLLGSSLCWQ